jgi:serine/threonine-protein kinase
MISAEGEVKITDFGIAKARNLMKDQEGQVLMGKAQYMSPEQAQYMPDRPAERRLLARRRHVRAAHRRVDLRHERGHDGDPRERRREGHPAPRDVNPDIPEALEKIIMKSLERNLSKRYQDAGKMGYDIEYFMYHKGYGPTIVTLEKYMRQLFPHLYKAPLEKEDQQTTTRPVAKGITIPTGSSPRPRPWSTPSRRPRSKSQNPNPKPQ